jgi:hypothetical protein
LSVRIVSPSQRCGTWRTPALGLVKGLQVWARLTHLGRSITGIEGDRHEGRYV